MSALILDGTRIAAQIRAEVGEEVKRLTAEGLRPGLAVVLVGHNPASEVYVRSKVKACEELGILSEKLTPPESASTEELLALVDELNRRDEIDGILVQLPLPTHVDSKKVSAGRLTRERRGWIPSHERRVSFDPAPGLGAVYSGGGDRDSQAKQHSHCRRRSGGGGRSDIVGKPVAMLLINGNATVTVCHSKTRDLPGCVPSRRYPGRCDRPRGDDHPRLCEAGRVCD